MVGLRSRSSGPTMVVACRYVNLVVLALTADLCVGVMVWKRSRGALLLSKVGSTSHAVAREASFCQLVSATRTRTQCIAAVYNV